MYIEISTCNIPKLRQTKIQIYIYGLTNLGTLISNGALESIFQVVSKDMMMMMMMMIKASLQGSQLASQQQQVYILINLMQYTADLSIIMALLLVGKLRTHDLKTHVCSGRFPAGVMQEEIQNISSLAACLYISSTGSASEN